MDWLLNAGLHLWGTTITWREIVGNLLGLASAALALRKRISAWPVGMIANVLLFTIFLGGVFRTPQDRDLYGQAGRQVIFFVISLYGWIRWHRSGRTLPVPVRPHWASARQRAALLAGAVAGVVVFTVVLRALDSFQPLADAWILTGSLLATLAMAYGWTEFWVIWVAVDAVGVPLLLRAHFYPSALMYGVYALLCVVGFVAWWRQSSPPSPAVPDRAATGASPGR